MVAVNKNANLKFETEKVEWFKNRNIFLGGTATFNYCLKYVFFFFPQKVLNSHGSVPVWYKGRLAFCFFV